MTANIVAEGRAHDKRSGALAWGSFYGDVLPDTGHYCLVLLPSGRHVWADNLDGLQALAAQHIDQSGLYFGTASYRDGSSRKASNVARLKALRLDIDAGPEKLAKHGAGAVYATQRDALAACLEFFQASSLVPSYVVSSGAGLHVYYCLTEGLAEADWKPLAEALQRVGREKGLKIDGSVTTDSARILRVPGAPHPNGKRVAILKRTGAFHDPAALREALGAAAPMRKFDNAHAVNADAVSGVDHRPFSLLQAAGECGALRLAMADRGASASYEQWLPLLVTAKASIEGRDAAHEFSSGHSDYDDAETERKLDSLQGGPASCATWERACGSNGPCGSCQWRGHVKGPYALGYQVDATMPGTAVALDSASHSNADATPDGGANTVDDAAPDWVQALNRRYALVRRGGSVDVLDEESPVEAADGVVAGPDWTSVGALAAMYAGRFVPPLKPGDKPRALVEAWRAHPGRRQYEGAVLAPPPASAPPSNVLNLWRGYAVEPRAGDVEPWLQVLHAVVPDDDVRRYVLAWVALKVQQPGTVPDTCLIFTGGKGTGKNSLFDPIMTIFGRHAMLADDAELVAGRFTGHLQGLVLMVLDEAVFTGDPRQMDRVKSRITGKVVTYESKGVDPVRGVNRCAFALFTNHTHVWQATTDERRAVIVETSDALRGDLKFWRSYHAWTAASGPATLLHYLQGLDVSGFDPRAIPRGSALARQVELTALKNPAVAWWHNVLHEGQMRYHDEGGVLRTLRLSSTEHTQLPREALRLSYEGAATSRGRAVEPWAVVARRWRQWVREAVRTIRPRAEGGARERAEELAPLPDLRAAFAAAVGVQVQE